MIHSRLYIFNPIPFKLIIIAMSNFLELNKNTFRSFKFAPNKQIPSLGIGCCRMRFPSRDQINLNWKANHMRMLREPFSSQLGRVIISPGVNLTIFGQSQIVHCSTNNLWNLNPHLFKLGNLNRLSALIELLLLLVFWVNLENLKLVALGWSKAKDPWKLL